MKKLICMALAFVMILALCACGENANTPTTKPGNNAPKDDNVKGYTFTMDGKKLGVNMKMSDVVALIGNAKDSIVSSSCAFEGNDTTHYYGNDLVITTSNSKGYDWVWQIELKSDNYKTEEGIEIGSTVDAVKTAYGNPDNNMDTKLVYGKDGMRLEFLITDGKVSSIIYTMAP